MKDVELAPLGDNRTASPELRRLNAPLSPHDPVNHPMHYGPGGAYETINVIEAWGLDFCLGNTVKYISCAGKKDPTKTIEDLEKARWYLDRRIEQLRRTP